jgi:hypothetical protein
VGRRAAGGGSSSRCCSAGAATGPASSRGGAGAFSSLRPKTITVSPTRTAMITTSACRKPTTCGHQATAPHAPSPTTISPLRMDNAFAMLSSLRVPPAPVRALLLPGPAPPLRRRERPRANGGQRHEPARVRLRACSGRHQTRSESRKWRVERSGKASGVPGLTGKRLQERFRNTLRGTSWSGRAREHGAAGRMTLTADGARRPPRSRAVPIPDSRSPTSASV